MGLLGGLIDFFFFIEILQRDEDISLEFSGLFKSDDFPCEYAAY